MRTIRKTTEPRELREWRARYQNDPNYGYDLLRQDHAVTEALTRQLVEEQGSLCAYTGRRIDAANAHLEHVNAQTHCTRGEDVDYGNLVACYPGPNTGQVAYGAHRKGSWPFPDERYLFVSPLINGCKERFTYNWRGEISSVSAGDTAAATTIDRLNLRNGELTAMRKAAIDGVLGETRNLSLKEARRKLRDLEQATTGRLVPFCFAVKPALRKFIRTIEAIRASKRTKRQGT